MFNFDILLQNSCKRMYNKFEQIYFHSKKFSYQGFNKMGSALIVSSNISMQISRWRMSANIKGLPSKYIVEN